MTLSRRHLFWMLDPRQRTNKSESTASVKHEWQMPAATWSIVLMTVDVVPVTFSQCFWNYKLTGTAAAVGSGQYMISGVNYLEQCCLLLHLLHAFPQDIPRRVDPDF